MKKFTHYLGLLVKLLVFLLVLGFALKNSHSVVFQSYLGYVWQAPLIVMLGLVLGPQMEEYFRRAMLLSRGDAMVFLERPISLGLLIAALALCVLVALPAIRSKREEAFQ